MNKPLFAFLVLLALLFAYSVYQFFQTHEYREVTQYAPFKGEARENPLFAARLFIRQMGIPAENKNNLQSIGNQYPDTHTTLILDTHRTTLSLRKIEQLLAWVREGGHLITRAQVDQELLSAFYEDPEDYEEEEATSEGDEPDSDIEENPPAQTSDNTPATQYCPDNSRDRIAELIPEEDLYSIDPLQSVLGIIVLHPVYLYPDEDDSAANDATKTTTLAPWIRQKNHVEFDIGLGGVDTLLTLAMDPYFYALYSADDALYESENNVLIQNELFLLQQKVGKGQVTLIADFSIFENQLLREADNAEILWHLLHTDQRLPSAVWLFHNDEMPNLFVLIWKYGWMVVLSLAALLLAWLYQSLHRFGPVIPKQAIARRRLLEHIDASGHYFWKKKDRQALIDSTRQALNQRIGQLHPTWKNTDEAGKVAHLAEMLKQPVANIQQLLFTAKVETDDDFIQLIKKLEDLRKHL